MWRRAHLKKKHARLSTLLSFAGTVVVLVGTGYWAAKKNVTLGTVADSVKDVQHKAQHKAKAAAEEVQPKPEQPKVKKLFGIF